MKKVTLQLETLPCPSCLAKIEGALNKLTGVESFKVLFNSSKVKAEIDETKISVEEVKIAIERLGFSVISYK